LPHKHRAGAARAILSLAAICLIAGHLATASAQAMPTASETLNLSVFAGVTGAYTGIDSGRNASVTAGADLSFLPIHRLFLSAEVRGTEPVDDGGVDDEKNILGGLKVAAHLGRLHPYANLLVGRGSIAYLGYGLQVPGKPIYYTLSHSTVYSPGFGLDYQITPFWSLKLDGQFQRYSTPVTTSGSAYAESGTVALEYRFNFNRHHPLNPY
jgi:hypothetical protein